jgi:hypothetical protein
MQDAAVAERQAPPRRGHALRHSTSWPSITARQTASSSSSSSSVPTFEEWSNSMSELARPKPTASVHASPQVHNGAGGRACRLDLPAVAVATHHGCAELACQALDDCGKPLTERGVVHGGLLWAGRQRPGHVDVVGHTRHPATVRMVERQGTGPRRLHVPGFPVGQVMFWQTGAEPRVR